LASEGADAGLVDYYRRRAQEYEAIYAKPERQADLASLRKILSAKFQDARVLEIACGTGYWTTVIAGTAASVLACDLAEESMQIARAKPYPRKNVSFFHEDAYRLGDRLGVSNGAYAGFWWSHIPRQRIAEFLESLHRRLASGARVLFMDNAYAEGSSTPIAEMDAQGNTYQMRRLADGSALRVLKNFPSAGELRERLAPYSVSFEFTALEYYWLAEYRLT
jgi:SAM-dependent methyltransferase